MKKLWNKVKSFFKPKPTILVVVKVFAFSNNEVNPLVVSVVK